MSIRGVSSTTRFARLAIWRPANIGSLFVRLAALANHAPQEKQQPSARCQIVVLLDINPDEQKVFSWASDSAMDMLDHLNQMMQLPIDCTS
jgi:hypothetical protein